jgi:hypothetical protein
MTENSKKGVEYYNKDNIEEHRITNDNTLRMNNGLLTSSLGLVANAPSVADESTLIGLPLERGQREEDYESGIVCPPPSLDEDQIDRAVIQLFDNGEAAKQRYKLKVRINLHGNDENPEFICPMTRDFRNFKKYIPEDGKAEVLELATRIRKHIKSKYEKYPYMGKFHLNNGSGAGIQVEPNTFGAVWYDNEENGWSGILMIQDWIYEFDLFKEYVTAKQKAAGVNSQTLFTNLKHCQKARPKTWAEKRAGK